MNVKRSNDEGLYQPKIHSIHIRALHQLSERTGEPMTRLLDDALNQYLSDKDLDEDPLVGVLPEPVAL